MHSRIKRIVAAVLSLVTLPGVGHYALGAPRAGVSWGLAFAVSFVACVSLCSLGGPALFVVGMTIALLVQLGAALDCVRVRTARSPAPIRICVLALAALCVAIGLKSLVRKYFVESYRVPGNAMYPSLRPSDKVLVSKLFFAPSRADVVVYREADGPTFMKRVMAVEWETVEVRADVVWVNGRSLPQQPSKMPCTVEAQCVVRYEHNAGRSYPIALSTKTSTLNPKPEVRVPMGQIFIMGDGRRWSFDSRMTGAIPKRAVIGTAKFVWWPLARFGVRP
jgi:signal peptidase I